MSCGSNINSVFKAYFVLLFESVHHVYRPVASVVSVEGFIAHLVIKAFGILHVPTFIYIYRSVCTDVYIRCMHT